MSDIAEDADPFFDDRRRDTQTSAVFSILSISIMLSIVGIAMITTLIYVDKQSEDVTEASDISSDLNLFSPSSFRPPLQPPPPSTLDKSSQSTQNPVQ